MNEQNLHLRPKSGGTRKHMGVATSDPDYLPPVKRRPHGPATGKDHIPPAPETLPPAIPGARGGAPRPSGRQPNLPASAHRQLNYSRYISTPKKGRSIFTSQQERQRKRAKIALIILIIAAIALALIWFFVLR